MIINSHNIEFGYELLSAVPRAYELYLQGKLTETISGIGSEPLYYFSPKHTINTAERSWFNTPDARRNGLPYTEIHKQSRPDLTFPPYKDVYANDKYKWEKPTLVIANRYNREWGVEPINFFDLNILEWLFSNLKKQYEIVYIAVDLPKALQDNEAPIPLNDRELCKKHGVKVFQDIKGECWNTSLLQVFANCEHYVTMNGGYAILASFFSGTNIAYTRERGGVSSKEYKHKEFDRYYPNHNNQRTVGVYNEDELKQKVQAIYIDKLPVANVIIRTSNRPNAFANAYNSVKLQDYPNINLVVTVDDRNSIAYTHNIAARVIEMKPVEKRPKPDGDDYGLYFPYNEYLERVQKRVDGYLFFLDDDDKFCYSNSVSEVMKHMDEDTLAIWKVKCGDNCIVPNGTFGTVPTLSDVSGIGICYHTKHKEKTDWNQWKWGDFRTARNLAETLTVKWIDDVLTKRQGRAGFGKRIDIVTKKDGYMRTVRVLKPEAGKVGSVKRIPRYIAEKQIKMGNVELIKDDVDRINKKPAAPENKVIITVNETKNENTKPRAAKTPKPRKSKAAAKN